jgi:hypothetical protein
LVTVKEIHPDGRIALAEGQVLDKRFCQFVRGYAVTSYASQGKSGGLRPVLRFSGQGRDE